MFVHSNMNYRLFPNSVQSKISYSQFDQKKEVGNYQPWLRNLHLVIAFTNPVDLNLNIVKTRRSHFKSRHSTNRFQEALHELVLNSLFSLVRTKLTFTPLTNLQNITLHKYHLLVRLLVVRKQRNRLAC